MTADEYREHAQDLEARAQRCEEIAADYRQRADYHDRLALHYRNRANASARLELHALAQEAEADGREADAAEYRAAAKTYPIQ